MKRYGIGTTITFGVLLGLCVSSGSLAEDLGPPPFDITCGGSCGDVLPKTRPNSLMSAIPGGTFVIAVAHIAPSPEDAIVHGVPAACDPVKFRVDMLKVKTSDGTIEVELGDQQKLAAGEASRIVYQVDPRDASNVPNYDMDLMGFRFRSEPASSRCSIAASGLFYAGPLAVPVPIALIPGVSQSPGPDSQQGGGGR